MAQPLTDSRIASVAANAICRAFDIYQDRFARLTRAAQMRFANRDWHGAQSDASDRLDVYSQAVQTAVNEIRNLLNHRCRDELIWAGVKAVFSSLIDDRRDRELAETFYNSVTRRIFTTVGVNPQIEFVDSDFQNPPPPARDPVYKPYSGPSSGVALIEAILSDSPLAPLFEDLSRDAELVHREIQNNGENFHFVEMITPVFYRGCGAYMIGRRLDNDRVSPFILCFLHAAGGVCVDAVLLKEDEVSILFSFTRSYFHVAADSTSDLILFLRSIMPRKPVSELYTSVGRNKHGKTELYRNLLHHLSVSDDCFEIAPGTPGMVMSVFTLPSFGVVFKVIKDSFDYPKKTDRRDVMAKYGLVFTHDRAGRLVDAQEFEHLRFDRSRFSLPLLQELLRVAKETVVIDEQSVVIKHLYTERRLVPLDLYVRNGHDGAAEAAAIDYGYALKDLAYANVFPGDVLVKNFGVTRHGRIIFYDYDELCLLTDCNFRLIPPASDEMEMYGEEPWFYVGENDYFPEEFLRFMGLPACCRDAFLRHHADLLQPDFWRSIQDRHRSGEIIHIFPYPQSKRIKKHQDTKTQRLH